MKNIITFCLAVSIASVLAQDAKKKETLKKKPAGQKAEERKAVTPKQETMKTANPGERKINTRPANTNRNSNK